MLTQTSAHGVADQILEILEDTVPTLDGKIEPFIGEGTLEHGSCLIELPEDIVSLGVKL